MLSHRTPFDPALTRLAEISSEFGEAARLVENAVDAPKKELRLSFDNGYSFRIEADGKASIEPF